MMRRLLPTAIALLAMLAPSAFGDSKAEIALQSQIASLKVQIATASNARASQMDALKAQLTAAAADREELLRAVAAIRADMPIRPRPDRNHAETMARVAETNTALGRVLAIGDDIKKLLMAAQDADASRVKRRAKFDTDAATGRHLQVITACFGALQFVMIVLLLLGRRRA